MLNQFLWVIFPYAMLTVFVVGHIYRYTHREISWTSKSSQFLENKQLKWGSTLFHFGLLGVLGGHLTLLVPKEVMEAVGITDHMYHIAAVGGGGTAGVVVLIGAIILLLRRFGVKRIRRNSSLGDLVVIVLLAGVILIGLWNTLITNGIGAGYEYRETVAPWIRGLLTLQPKADLMGEAPLFFKLHILMIFTIAGLWPFTRLVHVWSFPIAYLKRSRILYRKRNTLSTLRTQGVNKPK